MLSIPIPYQLSLSNLFNGERQKASMDFPTHNRNSAKMRVKSASTTAIPAQFLSGKALTNGCANGFSNGLSNGYPEKSDALNIIIPIGGIGSRFQTEGYRFPKPLINIVGRPMIAWLIERLTIQPHDTVWIAINEEIDNEFHVNQLMRKWFPKHDIRLLRLNYLTKGATETVCPAPPSFYLRYLILTEISFISYPKAYQKLTAPGGPSHSIATPSTSPTF